MEAHFELDQVRQSARLAADENEAALAVCASHEFDPLNPFLARSSYRCRACKGIVGPAAYLQHRQESA